MNLKMIIKSFFGVSCLFLALILIFVGGFHYTVNCKEILRDTSTSPDEKYELSLIEKGEPDWPFGPAHAKIALKDKNGVISTHYFNVSNDGATISENNWTVFWKENCVQIIVNGEEQYDKLYTMHFDGTVEAETIFS